MTTPSPKLPREAASLDLSSQLCFAIYSAAQAFTRAYRPLLEPLGLTYPQYLVMLTLWQADGLSVGQIGDLLHLESSTLTPLIKRLETASHVARVRDKGDERVVRVHLTPSGRALRSAAAAIPVTIACATDLPSDRIASLRDELLAVRDAMNLGPGAKP